jgi:hypothetical protein
MNPPSKKVVLTWTLPLPVIALALFFYLFFKGHSWGDASDICFILSVCSLAVPVLILVFRSGIFDTANYGFITFFASWTRNAKKPYADAYTYRQIKADKRSHSKPFLLPFFIYGFVLLLSATAFLIVFFQTR